MTDTEKFTVSGSQLVEKVKQLIHEGNIRKVRLLHEGRTVIELPLSIRRSSRSAGDYGGSGPGSHRGFRRNGNRMHH